MAAEVQGAAAGSPAAASPLDRDPREFPFGLLLVAPGIFESVSGFSWFASEAEAADYLRQGVWPAIDLDADYKRACMQMFTAVLSEGDGLSPGVLDKLGRMQDTLIVAWAGVFQDVLDGSDDVVPALLADTAEQVGNKELLGSPEGLVCLMAEYRWQYTGGAEGVRAMHDALPEADREPFRSGLQSAARD